MNQFNVDELKTIFKTNRCLVSFTKKNGEEREMECTLNPELMPKVQENSLPKRTKKENNEVLAVWDLNKKEFRSFRLSLLKSYKVLN
jgi:hypothetical protein